jgi:hypothetical protein
MKQIKSKSDLIQDKRNANAGSVRGQAAVAESLSRYGAGRSILTDKNGKIIAGNTTESNWEGDILVVPTDGSKLVVVQRTDLDLDSDKAARELAHADNRTNQLGYTPNVELIDSDMTDGVDLSWLWRADELEAMRGVAPSEREEDFDMDKVPKSVGHELVVVFNTEEEMRKAKGELQDLGYYVK